MVDVASKNDTTGEYLVLDIRNVLTINQNFDGIWASACLYHITSNELEQCLLDFSKILNSNGVLYLSMKSGEGSRIEAKPLSGYSGGDKAIEILKGERFYSYYSTDTLSHMLEKNFYIIKESPIEYSQGGVEFWVRKKD